MSVPSDLLNIITNYVDNTQIEFNSHEHSDRYTEPSTALEIIIRTKLTRSRYCFIIDYYEDKTNIINLINSVKYNKESQLCLNDEDDLLINLSYHNNELFISNNYKGSKPYVRIRLNITLKKKLISALQNILRIRARHNCYYSQQH